MRNLILTDRRGQVARSRAHRRDAGVLVLDSAPCAAAAHIFVGGAFRDRASLGPPALFALDAYQRIAACVFKVGETLL